MNKEPFFLQVLYYEFNEPMNKKLFYSCEYNNLYCMNIINLMTQEPLNIDPYEEKRNFEYRLDLCVHNF